MPSLKHTHQYIRFHSRPKYMRCAHPECTHFILRELTVGKKSVCNGCGKEFILEWRNLRLAKPLGPCCSMLKVDKDARERTEKLKELFGEKEEEKEKVSL